MQVQMPQLHSVRPLRMHQGFAPFRQQSRTNKVARRPAVSAQIQVGRLPHPAVHVQLMHGISCAGCA